MIAICGYVGSSIALQMFLRKNGTVLSNIFERGCQLFMKLGKAVNSLLAYSAEYG